MTAHNNEIGKNVQKMNEVVTHIINSLKDNKVQMSSLHNAVKEPANYQIETELKNM